MTPEAGLYVVAAAIATGLFTWLAARAKARADARMAESAQQVNLSGTTWDQAQEWLKRLDAEVKDLKAENERLNEKHDRLWEENRRLRDENLEQQRLLEDLAQFILKLGPPFPKMPLRVEEHINRIRRIQDR